MVFKSRLKWQSRQTRSIIDSRIARNRKASYWIIVSSIALIVCSILCWRDTFIQNQLFWLITLTGSLVGAFSGRFLLKKFEFSLWDQLFLGMLSGGAIVAFSVLVPNYLFRSPDKLKFEADILKTGNHRRWRSSSCNTPYALVKLDEIEKRLYFPCEFSSTINKYRRVQLYVSVGLYGMYIVQDKKLLNKPPAE